jgi:hypothetical protein
MVLFDSERFAITFKEDMGEKDRWLLWHYRGGQWFYCLFLEQTMNRNNEWEALHGVVLGFAVVANGWDLFLVMEHVETVGQIVWLVYVVETGPLGLECMLVLKL